MMKMKITKIVMILMKAASSIRKTNKPSVDAFSDGLY